MELSPPQPALAGFVLVGDSALALTIRHCRSEDLDFVFPEVRLPRERLDTLARNASQAGFDFQRNDDESAVRSKARDWLDLYLLLRQHGFTILDFQRAFEEAGIAAQSDIGLARLCSGVPQRDDEGYAHLLAGAPSLEEMKAFFLEQRNKLEIENAAEAARRKHGQPNPL